MRSISINDFFLTPSVGAIDYLWLVHCYVLYDCSMVPTSTESFCACFQTNIREYVCLFSSTPECIRRYCDINRRGPKLQNFMPMRLLFKAIKLFFVRLPFPKTYAAPVQSYFHLCGSSSLSEYIHILAFYL